MLNSRNRDYFTLEPTIEDTAMSSYLEEARQLLEQAERETDPARKVAALEEAIDLLEEYVADPAVPNSQRDLASNLRHSNIRRLVRQLVEMRDIQFNVWIAYIKLLLLRLEPEVKAILAEDPSLKDGYNQFVRIWKDELLDLLQRPA